MNYLTPYLMYIKIALVAMLVAGSVWLTKDHYQGVIAQKDLDLATKSAALVKQKTDLIQQAGEQRATDQSLINFLRNESGVVRIHIPSNCGDPTGNTDQDRAARSFSEALDSSLAEVREGDRVDAFRCDQLNIDAIESNTANQ